MTFDKVMGLTQHRIVTLQPILTYFKMTCEGRPLDIPNQPFLNGILK